MESSAFDMPALARHETKFGEIELVTLIQGQQTPMVSYRFILISRGLIISQLWMEILLVCRLQRFLMRQRMHKSHFNSPLL